MGTGRYDPAEWDTYSTTRSYATKSAAEIFTSREIHKDLDPRGIKVRESRDSAINPNSLALILVEDVTGSMGMISEVMAKKGIPTAMSELYARKPGGFDPHILCAAVGDVEMGDRAPFQITQFEADIRISEQLEKFYLEGGGGSNGYESYALAWYFASNYTSIDCFEKRGKKGYLFTIGDELPTPYLRGEDIERVFGVRPQANQLSCRDLLTAASRSYEIFHIVVEEGNGARYNKASVENAWRELLGQHVLMLSDHTKLPEVIVSAIEVIEGKDTGTVAKSWDGSTSVVVADAIRHLKKGSTSAGGLVTL